MEFHVKNLRSKNVAELIGAIQVDPSFPVLDQPPVLCEWVIKKSKTPTVLDPHEQVVDMVERWERHHDNSSVNLIVDYKEKAKQKKWNVAQRGKNVLDQLKHIIQRPSDNSVITTTEGTDEIDNIIRSIPFGEQSFNSSLYVENLFKKMPEKTMREILNSVQEEEHDAKESLQKSVHNNYKKFMEVSRQIENFEGDVQDLRNLLTEVNLILKGLNSIHLNLNKAPLTIRDRAKLEGLNLNNFIHWFLELPDELDILTSERLFDEAINNINTARQLVRDNPQLAIADAYIKEELNGRIRNLSDILVKDLQNPGIKKSESILIINHLQALDFSSKACEVFLQTRTKQLKSELSTLGFDGNVKPYVTDLSRIIFSSIRSTCDDFRQSFAQHGMMSGFVVWSMKVLRQFRSRFTRHVFDFGDREDFRLMIECFEIAKKECLELEAKGLSLMFYIQHSFHKDFLQSIDSFQKRFEESINGQFSEESWVIKKKDDTTVEPMTSSGIYVYNVVKKFIYILPLINSELVVVVVNTISFVIEKYLFELSTYLDTHTVSDEQYLAIVANAQYLSRQFNSVKQQRELSPKLQETTKEDKERMHALYDDIKDSYCNFLSSDLVNSSHRLDWGNIKYSMAIIDETTLVPSEKLTKLFKYLHSVATQVKFLLGEDTVHPITSTILQRVLVGLTKGRFWKDEKETTRCMFGEGGISQFVLDMKYAVEASGPFITETARTEINKAIERALFHFVSVTRIDPKKVLQDDSWYKRTIKKNIEKSKTLNNPI